MNFRIFPLIRPSPDTPGYSLLELTAVVATIGIISAIAIPPVLNVVRLNRIDEAKALLNTTSAWCLQELRRGNDITTANPTTELISNDRLESIGYKIKDRSDTCSNFFIAPINTDENLLYEMGFRISADGKVLKIAIPAKDQASLSSCKAWAGPNCGITPELQAEWDRLAAIEKAKKECNDSFYEWLRNTPPNGGSGSRNRWDDATNTCSLSTWAFEGTIQKDETAFRASREAKLGKICSQKLKDRESTSFDGLFDDQECGISTYFCSGKDLNTANKTDYDACKEEERQKRCTAAEGNWKQSGPNGMFSESGCTALWKCNSTVFSAEADYNSSSCGQICTEEKIQIGTRIETVQTGTTPIRDTVCRVVGSARRCAVVTVGSTPVFSERTVPTYKTRQDCRPRT